MPEKVDIKIAEAPVLEENWHIVADSLLNAGYTKQQVAGILGNLHQEHNFKTDDVPGGLGIAQWLGSRRANLLSKSTPYDIATQASFIIEELNGVEHRANSMLKASTTVEQSTIAFQNGYERCGDCRQSQRISYALEYYGRL
jgi:hypothetical protein